MAFKFVVAALAMMVVADQASASCFLPQPPCVGAIPAFNPSPFVGAIPAFNVPASLPCAPVQTKTVQHPDIKIPLPVPEEIPIGNFCACQKYEIARTLVPCSPAAAPAPSCVAPAVSLSPSIYRALFRGVPAPCAACGCA